MARRIGILGGTFDPPHLGHLVVAGEVRWACELDVVLLVVANVPWQKVGQRPLSPAEDRVAMTEAAIAGLDGIEVSRLEVDRGGDSYTIDTLEAIAEAEPDAELVVILGHDAAALLPTWRSPEEVARRARLVVVTRADADAGPLPAGYTWEHVKVPEIGISSTMLRARVAAGAPIGHLTPPGVVAIVEERRLYRDAP